MIEKKKAVNLGGHGFAGEREERVRLLRADADMREIELAKKRSQLVALSDVEAAMTDLVLTTKARVMAIAPQLAPELVGETSRVMIQAKIDKAHRKALCYLAKAANDRNPSEGNHGATGTVPSPRNSSYGKKKSRRPKSASVNQMR